MAFRSSSPLASSRSFRRLDSSMAHFCSIAPGARHRSARSCSWSCCAVSGLCDCRGHCGDPGAAKDQHAIRQARRGRKVYGGQTQYMPLKINYAGVMPIIFAQAILLFPSTIINMAFPQNRTAQEIAEPSRGRLAALRALWGDDFLLQLFLGGHAISARADRRRLKKYGGFIPGCRPGKPTADFLDFTMSRLTFAGAIFLTVIAVLPQLLAQALEGALHDRAVFRRHGRC